MFKPNGTTSVPKFVPRLMLDKVKLLCSSEMLYSNIFKNLCHLIEEQFNIEIQTIFNSHCVFLLFGKTSNEFRLQFNVRQSSTTKLLLQSVTPISLKQQIWLL